MEIIIAHSLEQKYSENTKNIVTLLNEIKGGSAPSFETPNPAPTEKAENDFTIKEVEKFDPVLVKDNTLDVDIISLLNTPFADISFIDIFCFTTTDTEKPIPIRFKVVLNDGVNDMDIGEMSHFSLTNIKDNKIQKITISAITVLDKDTVQLIVTVGSKSKNE